MKRILICTLAGFATLLLPACETDEITTTTTTTEETVARPAGMTTETTRTTAY
jgi:hypothetical protein